MTSAATAGNRGPRVALIGAGNMGAALARAWVAAGAVAERLTVYDRDHERAAALCADLGCARAATGDAAALGAETVVLAVKPQDLGSVARGFAATDRHFTLVSILAGATTGRLEAHFGDAAGIVRAMPNLAVTIGAGVTAIVAGRTASEEDMARAEALLGAAGTVVRLADEALMDAVTAVSGSGPAYFFLLAEALADAGHGLGLDADLAARLAERTAMGAGRLMAEGGGVGAAEWRQRVTSKGGTTERALAVFEAGQLREMVREAVVAAAERSRELSSG